LAKDPTGRRGPTPIARKTPSALSSCGVCAQDKEGIKKKNNKIKKYFFISFLKYKI
jgi:hypothetical protein